MMWADTYFNQYRGVESMWTLRPHRTSSRSQTSQSIDVQCTDRKRTQILPHGLCKPVQPHMHTHQLLSKRHYMQTILSPTYPQLRNSSHKPMGAAIAYMASLPFEFGPAGEPPHIQGSGVSGLHHKRTPYTKSRLLLL